MTLGSTVLGGGSTALESWGFLSGYQEPPYFTGFVGGMDGTAYSDSIDPFYQLCLNGPDFLLVYLSWESMFCDGRASQHEVLQDGESLRGWFGYHAPISVGGVSWNQAGSKLWTHSRSLLVDLTPAKIKADIESCHKWMVEAGLIQACSATVQKSEDTADGAIAAVVEITKLDGLKMKVPYSDILSV